MLLSLEKKRKTNIHTQNTQEQNKQKGQQHRDAIRQLF